MKNKHNTCPECGVVWTRVITDSASTFPFGYCSNCNAGPYIVDDVKAFGGKKQRGEKWEI